MAERVKACGVEERHCVRERHSFRVAVRAARAPRNSTGSHRNAGG
ncbi:MULTISPECIES: hypothetical protein [Streptomyces]|nr:MULTISPECIES: hypothetical protein [Streptomyces]